MSDLNALADRVEALAVPCAVCGISNKWHGVHLAPFDANYHEYKAAQRPDSKGFPMTDTITPALLDKMAEAPWSVVRYSVSLNYEGGPSWGAKHKKADMAEIEFGDECQAQAECDRLNALHRAQYVQPLVDALKRVDGPHKCPRCAGFGEVAYCGEMVSCGCEKPFFADVTTDSRLALRQALAQLGVVG